MSSHVEVSLPIGSATFPRCTADVFDPGVLTVTTLDENVVTQVYERGRWRQAKVVDDKDCYTLFAFDAVAPIVLVCAWCADSAEKTAAATATGADVSHILCWPCQQRMAKEIRS